MSDTPADFRTGMIVVAEDSPTQAAHIEGMLVAHGFAVRLAGDGAEALRLVRAEPPDVVLTDVLMPEMDGFELCRQIRQDPALADVPVVLLTELQEADNIVNAISVGASGFLVKPCDEEALIERLYYLLANRQFRRRRGVSLRLGFRFAGQEYEVDAEQTQLLDLLFATFEDAVRRKRLFEEANRQLRDALNTVEAMARLLQAEQALDLGATDRLAGTRVLVVEDSAVQAERLRAVLDEHGLAVTVATNGEAGYEAARRVRPEIILSDVVMPVMDGYEMCRRIKADECLRHVPVVLLTTLSDPMDIVLGMNAGADFYLTKPCDGDYLLYRLAGVLSSRHDPAEDDPVESLQVNVDGQTHEIVASRHRLLDLMISTYENAVQQNRELQRLKAELQTMNANLEGLVTQRTADLVTAKDRLEQALSDLKAQQQQLVQQERLRALGEMASGIAHDFNNCLSVIMGFAGLMEKTICPKDQTEECAHHLHLIHTAARDGANVVARLREFYRRREEDEDFVAVDIAATLRQAIDLTTPKWRAQTQARGISITIEDRIEPVPAVAGNAADLREIFTNLIMNAADAMVEDGTITVSATRRDGQVVVSVADTGSGMSETTRQRCLEPFYTTKGNQGTGLGLSVAYGIIRRHGGKLDIASDLGQGTCITITFPLAADNVASDTGDDNARHALAPGTSLRVMVVEDNPSIRNMLACLLADSGHAAVGYANGQEALAHLDDGPVDLAIVDRAMPGMNGDQLARELKARQPHLPIIMLTGFGAMMTAVGERPHGVDLVLAKPVDQNALMAAIGKVVTGA